jgi:prepilin-type N-terminal cleavage/methylation domain-containing protein
MRTRAYKSGFTLIEMLMVVAIIAILVSMVVGVAKRIDDQSKERLCRNTIALIGNALEQFRDFGYEYKNSPSYIPAQSDFYRGLKFPLDCNGLILPGAADIGLEQTLREALYPPPPPILFVNILPTAGYDPKFSGSVAMYFILSQVPDCRTTLDKIDKSLLTNMGTGGNPIEISIVIAGVTTARYPCTRIIDPWGTTLRYDYYDEHEFDYDLRSRGKKTFPVITSAGPDKRFDTADDISNVK